MNQDNAGNATGIDLPALTRYHHNEHSKEIHTDPIGEFLLHADVEAALARAQPPASTAATQPEQASEFRQWLANDTRYYTSTNERLQAAWDAGQAVLAISASTAASEQQASIDTPEFRMFVMEFAKSWNNENMQKLIAHIDNQREES